MRLGAVPGVGSSHTEPEEVRLEPLPLPNRYGGVDITRHTVDITRHTVDRPARFVQAPLEVQSLGEQLPGECREPPASEAEVPGRSASRGSSGLTEVGVLI